MSKQLLAAAALVALSSPALAANIIVNGGFETGVLSPWYNANDFSFDGVPWAVVSGGAHSGLYSAGNIGNIEIRQDFAGVAASSVTAASFWLRHPTNAVAPAAVTFFYSDAPYYEFVVDSTSTVWQQFDVLSQLDTSKTLTGFSVYGYNGEGNNDTFLDDVLINVGGAVPEPASWAMLIAGFGLTGAAMRRRRATVAA